MLLRKIDVFFTIQKNIVRVSALAMFFFFVSLSSYGLGSEEETDVPLPQNLLEEDPIFRELLDRDIKRKPSLGYMKALASAKNSIANKDYYEALAIYTDMLQSYGNIPEIIFGLGETHFLLGDSKNSMLYYNQILETDVNSSGQEMYIMDYKEAILASYRMAYLYYQQGNMSEYENALIKIVNSSSSLDISLLSLIETQSLDYVISLSQVPIDYSYVARRELGVLYAFNQDRILDERAREIEKAFLSEEEKIVRLDVLTNQLERDMLAHLFGALGMAVRTFTEYIATTEINYSFTDLAQMIELLNQSSEGQALMRKFDLERMLVAIRKYYISESELDTKNNFAVLYCTELLEQLSFYEDETSTTIYIYYSNLE